MSTDQDIQVFGAVVYTDGDQQWRIPFSNMSELWALVCEFEIPLLPDTEEGCEGVDDISCDCRGEQWT